MKRIAIGTDHGGFTLKEGLKKDLAERGFEVFDCGTYTPAAADYPVYAGRVARAVSQGSADFGVIVCRTGNGMAMVANRYPGVRAGIAMTPETARLTREHNGANVLVLAADHTPGGLTPVLDAWLESEPEGGRHARRVDMIGELDRERDSTAGTYALIRAGQSPWIDDLSAGLIASGRLARLVHEAGLRGLTSNPTIFEAALRAGDPAYAASLADLRTRKVAPDAAYDELLAADIRAAADVLAPVHAATGGDDGFVSLELPPALSRDTDGSVREALATVERVSRPNLMVKVPATDEGIVAIRELITRGVSINVTLIFGLEQYRRVAQAYIDGLRARLANGDPIHTVRSVASVFVSRVDRAIEKAPEAQRAFFGKLGLANAWRIHAASEAIFGGDAFEGLPASGGVPQRVLWASTAPKGDALDPLLYVDNLVAPRTVTTLPPATFDRAAAGVRIPTRSIAIAHAEAEATLAAAASAGLDLSAITARLLEEGLESFAASDRAARARVAEALG